MSKRRIILNHEHYEVLRRLVDKLTAGGSHPKPHFTRLAHELEEALVMDSASIPENVVTINSRVRWVALDSQKEGEGLLTFPADAREGTDRISVLSPFGLALIGEPEGSTIDYEAPGGTYRVYIQHVQHVQPAGLR